MTGNVNGDYADFLLITVKEFPQQCNVNRGYRQVVNNMQNFVNVVKERLLSRKSLPINEKKYIQVYKEASITALKLAYISYETAIFLKNPINFRKVPFDYHFSEFNKAFFCHAVCTILQNFCSNYKIVR